MASEPSGASGSTTAAAAGAPASTRTSGAGSAAASGTIVSTTGAIAASATAGGSGGTISSTTGCVSGSREDAASGLRGTSRGASRCASASRGQRAMVLVQSALTVVVLFAGSTPRFLEGYEAVSSSHPAVRFMPERDFGTDVLGWLVMYGSYVRIELPDRPKDVALDFRTSTYATGPHTAARTNTDR